MERLLTMDKEQFISDMQAEVRQILGRVADAVNDAPTGNVISGSELAVRDAMAELRQRVFEKAVPMRLDSTESSWSPSEGRDGQSPAKQGPPATDRAEQQRADRVASRPPARCRRRAVCARPRGRLRRSRRSPAVAGRARGRRRRRASPSWGSCSAARTAFWDGLPGAGAGRRRVHLRLSRSSHNVAGPLGSTDASTGGSGRQGPGNPPGRRRRRTPRSLPTHVVPTTRRRCRPSGRSRGNRPVQRRPGSGVASRVAQGGKLLGRGPVDLVNVELEARQSLLHEGPLGIATQQVGDPFAGTQPDFGLAAGYQRRGLGSPLRPGCPGLTAIRGLAFTEVLEQQLQPLQYMR